MSNCTTCTSTTTPPPACNCPPSPEAPWTRPKQSPLTQTLTDAGALSLTTDVTYLNKAGGTASITIPDGNYKRQIKRVYVVKDRVDDADSATWTLTGTFLGVTSWQLDSIGYSLVLEWTGEAWVHIGGNATPTL